METTTVIAVYGAVIGTISFITSAGLAGIQVWRSRAAVKVDWSRGRTVSPRAESEDIFIITTHLKGRHPVRVSSVSIGLEEGMHVGKLWRRKIRQRLAVIGELPGVLQYPFPKTLTPDQPMAEVVISAELLRRSFQDGGTPRCALMVSSIGERRKKLTRQGIEYLTRAPESSSTTQGDGDREAI